MIGKGKSCAARPREQGRHAVSMIRRAVSMKIHSGKREPERQHCGDEKEAEDSQPEERS